MLVVPPDGVPVVTGPEHYREAERVLAQAHTVDPEFAAYLVAKAQAHATLALAAATAQGSAALPPDGNTAGAWRTAIAAPRRAAS